MDEHKMQLSKRDVCDLVSLANWHRRKQQGSEYRVIMKAVKILCPEYEEVLEERRTGRSKENQLQEGE